MTELTNAQAALQAAATLYSGARGYTLLSTVKDTAKSFKNWLDQQDKEARAQALPSSEGHPDRG